MPLSYNENTMWVFFPLGPVESDWNVPSGNLLDLIFGKGKFSLNNVAVSRGLQSPIIIGFYIFIYFTFSSFSTN